MDDPFNTTVLNDLLARARAARRPRATNSSGACSHRLELLTRKMLKTYPPFALRRDGRRVQNAAVRLVRALNAVTPTNTREFFGLAASKSSGVDRPRPPLPWARRPLDEILSMDRLRNCPAK